MRLLAEKESGLRLKESVESTIDSMRDEITSLLQIDGDSYKSLAAQLREDEKLWIAIAALIGTTVGTITSIDSTIAAITVLSLMGTKGLKASRERRKVLAESPWASVYYLRRV